MRNVFRTITLMLPLFFLLALLQGAAAASAAKSGSTNSSIYARRRTMPPARAVPGASASNVGAQQRGFSVNQHSTSVLNSTQVSPSTPTPPTSTTGPANGPTGGSTTGAPAVQPSASPLPSAEPGKPTAPPTKSGQTIFPGLPAAGIKSAILKTPLLGQTITDLLNHDPIEVLGMPMARIRPRTGGGIVIELTLRTKYADSIQSLEPFYEVVEIGVDQLQKMSSGPLSSSELRRRNHPYGRGKYTPAGAKRGKIGRMYTQGVRGAVPNLTIINSQSGKLAQAWYGLVKTNAYGITIEFHNPMPYSLWLAYGTRKMQAHGPFTYVPVMLRSQLTSVWQQQVSLAKAQQTAMAMIISSVSENDMRRAA